MKRSIVPIAFIVLPWLAHCEAFDRQRYNQLRADSGSEAGCTAGLTEDAACGTARFPAIPSALANQPSDGRTYIVALKSLQIGGGSLNGWQNFGFDLDGVCSDPAGMSFPQSCRNNMISDGVNGRDNTFGLRIAPLLAFENVLTDRAVNDSIGSGLIVPAMRITEWGGGDDREIKVEFLTVVRGQPPMGAMGLTWDGRDSWQIETTVTNDAMGAVRLRSTTGHVVCQWTGITTQGLLELYIPQRTALRKLIFRNAVLGGNFSPARGGTLDIGGYNNMSDYLDNLRWVDLCPAPHPNAQTYEAVRSQATTNFDMLESGAIEPNRNCDAMSAGIRTEWAPITLREPTARPELFTDPCATDAGATDAAVSD